MPVQWHVLAMVRLCHLEPWPCRDRSLYSHSFVLQFCYIYILFNWLPGLLLVHCDRLPCSVYVVEASLMPFTGKGGGVHFLRSELEGERIFLDPVDIPSMLSK